MYNKTEIDKNLKLFTHSLDEIFYKLSANEDDEVLSLRAEVTFALAHLVKDAIFKYQDPYIDSVLRTIDAYAFKYDGVRTGKLKSYAELASA